MSVLNRLTCQECNNLQKTLKKFCEFKNTYVKPRNFYLICYDTSIRDFLYVFSKSLPFIYYKYSQHRLNHTKFDTTLIAVWPDLREEHIEEEYLMYRNKFDPVFIGIRIPFNQSDNFLSTYKNALFHLLKNDDRELTPTAHYRVLPILTFENIDPAQYLNFTSFVEYYGEYWGGLCEYLKRPEPLGENEKYEGFIGHPGSLFDCIPYYISSRCWGSFEFDEALTYDEPQIFRFLNSQFGHIPPQDITPEDSEDEEEHQSSSYIDALVIEETENNNLRM